VRERFEKDHPAVDFELRPSRGGVFELTVDGILKWSKKAEGRFPTDDEIEEVLASL